MFKLWPEHWDLPISCFWMCQKLSLKPRGAVEGWRLQILTSCNIKKRTSGAHSSSTLSFLDFITTFIMWYDVMKHSQNFVRTTILHVHQSWTASIYPVSSTLVLPRSNHGRLHVASKLESLSFLPLSCSCRVGIAGFSLPPLTLSRQASSVLRSVLCYQHLGGVVL